MNRPALSITNLTVAGTYRLTFRVDSLVKVINLVIKDPVAKLVLAEESTLSTFELDTTREALIVNQVGNNTLIPAQFNGQLFLEDLSTAGTIDTADKLFFFKSWKPNTALTGAGLKSERPAVAAAAGNTYYATDENVLYTTLSAETTWDDAQVVTGTRFRAATNPKIMNFVGNLEDIENILNPTVGQTYYAKDQTSAGTVYTYLGNWETTEAGGTVVTATDTGVALTGNIATLETATAAVVVDGYYYNAADGIIYKGATSVSAGVARTAAAYTKLSKPIINTSFANLSRARMLPSLGNDTFEILATVSALTPADSNVDFRANLNLYDIAPGTYAYSVKTTFPDGRVVENADNATVSATGNDSLGKVTPTSLSGNFANHWKLEVTKAVVGTYTFEFKFGIISRTIKVVVKDNVQAKVNSVSFGAVNTPLFNGNYLIKDNSSDRVNGNIVASISPVGMTSSNFYRISLETSDITKLAWISSTSLDLIKQNDGATAAANASVTNGPFIQVPETFTSLTIGRLTDFAIASTAATAKATIEWFEKVEIGVNLATGDKVFSYNKIGETQVLNFIALAS
jgi:hypothetical protein